MKAMQVTTTNNGPVLIESEVPTPEPGDTEVSIRVHAAGVTPSELVWYPTTHTLAGEVRSKAIPGHEFSGVIAGLGKDVQGYAIGDEVFGMNSWFADGATAEYCLAQPASLASKPDNLTHELAATVPIGALTAWQGLFDRARLQAGERVLVHGGSGAVGLFAVQLAHNHGAYVIATASAHNLRSVQELEADEVIDYRATRFEDAVKDVDVVFDTVGGETLSRSWQVLNPGGRMIAIASDAEGTTEQRVKDAFFIVEPNQKQLIEIAGQLQQGRIRTFVKASVPLDRASAAYEGKVDTKTGIGKVIISVVRTSND